MTTPKHSIEELRNRADLNREQRRELTSALQHIDQLLAEKQTLMLRLADAQFHISNALKSLK